MKAMRMSSLFLIGVAALTLIPGCKQSEAAKNTLTLATTTSTQDSGLLDVLLPKFREQTGIEVKVVAVGSGQALELGRRGDADMLLTHAPAAEEKFMEQGWGKERRPVMHNDFVLVGPKSDPATVKKQKSIAEAFSRIADGKAVFVSRGDESGTHHKEKEVWKKAGREPEGECYVRAGAGMAQVLRMAHEKKAYTLTDRGTFLVLRKELQLVVVSEGDPLLKNRYAVIVVNPEKHPHVNASAAMQFADFLTSPNSKKLIAEFGVDRFGEPLFFTAE
jgi:tungstate transport system substrate-binding protein